jgi:hypothetical protein
MPWTHLPLTPKKNHSLSARHLSLLVAEDVGVTSVEDSHGGASEELTAGGTELDL